MSSTKKALKSIKTRLEERDHEAALYEATNLLRTIGKDAPEASQVLVFRGLSLTHLGRQDEAEKCYVQAIHLDPTNPLATVGLKKLYERNQEWDKLGTLLEISVQENYDANEAEKCAGALQDLVELRSKHGPEEKLYQTLALLLPSSPLAPLLQSVPPPASAYTPFASPTYPPTSPSVVPSLPSPLPHVLHLLSSLPLLLHMLIRSQALLHGTIEVEVKKARQRIGAGPEKEVRKNVEGEILGGEAGLSMVDLLREVGGHPGVGEEIRRGVEIDEFVFWKKLVGCVSSEPANGTKGIPGTDTPVPPLFRPTVHKRPTKADARARVDDLARGFVLLGINSPGSEEGWSWIIEGTDESTLFYDLDLLHKFTKAFPQSHLTDFIDDYCRWFKLPLPDPEEVPEPAVEELLDDEGEVIQQPKKKAARAKNKAAMNAKERRKAKRLAGLIGGLAEDIDQEEREELVVSMTKLLDQLPRSIFAHRVLARICIEEKDWTNAIGFSEKGRKLVQDLEGERGVQMNKAQIWEAAGKWSEARKFFQILLDAGGSEKEMVNAKEEVGWCLVNEGKLKEGRDVLESVVEARDSTVEERDEEQFARARAWWRLGRTEWDIGDKESREHAEEWFMASMRALSSYAPAYTSLGMCFSSANPPDEERALACFQKAFELDATEAEAARRLAIGYADQDEWSLVRTVSMRVMEGEGGLDGVVGGQVMNAKGRFAPKNGWAWKALGSTEVHYRNYAKAAQAYQIALRAEEGDVSTWVMLGEAYVKCGRHVAGLKALNHALDLDPSNWMAMFHIGDVYSQLGDYGAAIASYEKVLAMGGDHEIGVTAALAEAMLASGRQSALQGFKERSRRGFHGALSLADKVLRNAEQKHRAWACKVVGDAAFELSSQESTTEDRLDSVDVLKPLLEWLVQDDDDVRSHVKGLGHAKNLLQQPVDFEFTLKTAIFAFAYRVHLTKNQPRVADNALYDLATALHSLAGRTKKEEEKTACMRAAISAIRLALEKDAGDERLWNALGVICESAGPQMAQHAFVVSLELYPKDPVVWANLGFLYLRLDDRDLANQCLLKAQTMDPDYGNAWLGQGMLAERNGDKEHAKALYAHAVTLSAGSLLEADLALAVSTFEKFLVPGQQLDVDSLHQPAFALRHYCHQRPRDSAALHLYALICERLGTIDESCVSLERAVALLEEEFEATESTEIEWRYSMALVNLGRVRLTARRYDQSLEAFTDCWELIENAKEEVARGLRVQTRLGQALASFWLELEDECREGYKEALEEAADKAIGLQEEIAVLYGRSLWNLGGDDGKEAAKSHLLECLSHEDPSIKVLVTLGAIAVLTDDEDLVDAVTSELQTRPLSTRLVQDPENATDLVLYSHSLAIGDETAALEILDSANQMHPRSNGLARDLLACGKAGQVGDLLDVGLRGLAAVVEGNVEGGVRLLQVGVRNRPWEAIGYERLAWGRGQTPGGAARDGGVGIGE
ncbi:superkiller protein 3, partial [Tremellales sp. Uapishka_1]